MITIAPTNSGKKKWEYYIMSEYELFYNVRNNTPIPRYLTHDLTFCRIYVIKSTELMGDIIKNESSTSD